MADNVFSPKFKLPPQSTAEISVKKYGPDKQFTTRVYLYGDVLEELQYCAKEKNAYGMLTGGYSIIPIEKRTNVPGEPLDFIEVTAFKDICPGNNALDYAGYLRKQRDFRPPVDGTLILGVAILQNVYAEPTLEDLLLMRSYFADQIQIALYITADRKRPRVYALGDTYESFAEIGYSVVQLAEEPPMFDEF